MSKTPTPAIGACASRRQRPEAPLMIPGEQPPADSSVLRQLEAESTFPTGDARYAIPPTCDGYLDVDTYRDLEFYILERK